MIVCTSLSEIDSNALDRSMWHVELSIPSSRDLSDDEAPAICNEHAIVMVKKTEPMHYALEVRFALSV